MYLCVIAGDNRHHLLIMLKLNKFQQKGMLTNIMFATYLSEKRLIMCLLVRLFLTCCYSLGLSVRVVATYYVID